MSDQSERAERVTHEADIRNGEPEATMPTTDPPLDQDPEPGKLPSDADVQAERQQPVEGAGS